MVFIENVLTCCDLDRGQTDMVLVCWVVLMDVSTLMIKNLLRPETTVCARFKVSNVNIFHDHLENKVNVKLMTSNKRFCHYTSCV